MSDAEPHPRQLLNLLDLARRAREASSVRELGFLLVNDTHQLLAFRQAAWCGPDGRVQALSGVLQPEANAPYAQWLQALANQWKGSTQIHPFESADVPQELAEAWGHWWPRYGLWLPLSGQGCMLARDDPWTQAELALLGQWASIWTHAHAALARSRRWLRASGASERAWWQRPGIYALAASAALLAWPVRLTVLAPGEMVPAKPLVVRAPMEGVLDTFHVQPNQVVQAQQPLFGFDEALIQSRLEVARQSLVTAQTEYRQTSQQALMDPRARSQLSQLAGKIDERRAEAQYLADQLKRSRVLAPKSGVVLMDDPSEWIGRPVTVGERILRIAAEGDVEVEAWLPLADAIDLKIGDEVELFLQADPLTPVQAKLRYLAHEAVDRPEGHQAFRVRATLLQVSTQRVGLKGTAKLYGPSVPLGYWMLRRPLATLRTHLAL
jgi:multidrug efflux pump subunit AcrA (membrane-fusion protein)